MTLKLDFYPLEGCSSAGKKIYRQSITFLKKKKQNGFIQGRITSQMRKEELITIKKKGSLRMKWHGPI